MLFLSIIWTVSAQTNQIKGVVISGTDEEALIGASVTIKGSNTGTITDINGDFSLQAQSSDVLIVTYLGFKTQEVAVGNNKDLQIRLIEDSRFLDEVIVVGYGVQKKSVVTGSISKVSSGDIETATPTRIEDVLKGRISGVSITQNSGQPGSASVVRIRGTGTINNSDPLYVVDGMPVEGGIDYLNPTDIASVEVLKDAASSAIYGSRAANGVILVTTKEGKIGKSQISYDFSYGWQNPWKKLSLLNASQYEMIMNEALANANQSRRYDDPSAAGIGTDWQDEVYNYDAPIVNHQISLSGGNEKTSYFLSFGYLDQEGTIGKEGQSKYTRYSLRANNQYNVFQEKSRKFFSDLKVGINIGYSRILSRGIDENNNMGGPLAGAIMTPPNQSVYVTDPAVIAQYKKDYGDRLVTDANGNVYNIIDNNEITNPVAGLEVLHTKNNSDKIVSSIWGELGIYEGLKFRSSYSVDLAFWGDNNWVPTYYLSNMRNNSISSVNASMNRGFTWNWENTMTYNKKINEHNFTVLLGTSAQKYFKTDVGGRNYNLFRQMDDKAYIDFALGKKDVQEAWGGAENHALASFFGRVNYNFKERYMLEAVVRRDGSSNFSPGNHWATFPSVSLGWNLSEEEFMKSTRNWMDRLKIRAGWGKNGNERIDAFQYTALMSTGNDYTLGSGSSEVIFTGVKPSKLTNPNLKWEETTEIDVGFDALFLNSTLSFSFDYYNRRTSDMLMTIPIPAYVGDAAPSGNVGTMENKGFEMNGGYRFNVAGISFDLGANATYVKNEVVDLGSTGFINVEQVSPMGYVSRHQNGFPVNYFYGLQANGIFQNQAEIDAYVNSKGEKLQPNAAPGDVRFVDIDNDGKIDADLDRTKIGKPSPDWIFGFNLSAQWKGFDFYMLWQGVTGNDIFDAVRRVDLGSVNYSSEILKRWTGEGTSDKYPRVVYGNADNNGNSNASSLYIKDGSYIRLKNMQIGYSLPLKVIQKAALTKFRVYAGFDNLLTFTNYKGFDPEIGSNKGVDKGVYPQSRTVTVGANISF